MLAVGVLPEDEQPGCQRSLEARFGNKPGKRLIGLMNSCIRVSRSHRRL